MLDGVAFYTVANSSHYPGAVALLNSLRLVGEDGHLVVVDCGLTEAQRDELSPHATVVPQHGELHPNLQKTTGPLALPAEIMVILDADVIATRPLTPLLEEARRGRIVVFENDQDRFVPEWSSLGLGELRRRRYACAAQLILPSSLASGLLPLYLELQERLDLSETLIGGADPSAPLYFADQDLLNVILCARYDEVVVRLQHRLSPVPPFPGLQVTDMDTLNCAYSDGEAPYFLHHILGKPWLAATRPNAYSRLFTRVTTGSDVMLPLRPRELPLRLRDSRFALIDRWRASIQFEAHRRLRGKLGIRPVVTRHVRKVRRSGRIPGSGRRSV